MRTSWKVWVLVGVGVLVGPAVQAQELKHQVFVERWWSWDVGRGLSAVGYEYRLLSSGALRILFIPYYPTGSLLVGVKGIFLPRLYGPLRGELGFGIIGGWGRSGRGAGGPDLLVGVRWERPRWVFRLGVHGILIFAGHVLFSSGVGVRF